MYKKVETADMKKFNNFFFIIIGKRQGLLNIYFLSNIISSKCESLLYDFTELSSSYIFTRSTMYMPINDTRTTPNH